MSEPTPTRKTNPAVFAVPLGLLTVGSLIGSAFMPKLLAKAPLALVALSPLFRHIVLVAPLVDPVSLFAVTVPRHFLPDPFMYFLGKEYGPLAVQWAEANSPAVGRMVRLLERVFAKIGPFALVISPDIIVSTLAGAAGVKLPVFVVMNVIGTFVTVFVARWIGDFFEQEIHALVEFFRAHMLVVTLASIALVVLFNWWSRRGSGSGKERPAE